MTTTQYVNQRSVPRFEFIASVEINDPASGVRLDGRISEISRKGCYIDVLNVLPKGTLIQLRISRDSGVFATAGRVIYAQEPMGMGVAFADTAPDQMSVLDSWLAEISA
jgi:PilZ domain